MEITCPNCAATLNVPESAAGRKGSCKRCGAVVTIPEVRKPEPVPPREVPDPPKVELAPCPDCGREISRRATSCPHCGHRPPPHFGLGRHLLLWLLAGAQAAFAWQLHDYGQMVLDSAKTILQEQLGMLVMILAAIGGLGSSLTLIVALIVAVNAPARIKFPKE